MKDHSFLQQFKYHTAGTKTDSINVPVSGGEDDYDCGDATLIHPGTYIMWSMGKMCIGPEEASFVTSNARLMRIVVAPGLKWWHHLLAIGNCLLSSISRE